MIGIGLGILATRSRARQPRAPSSTGDDHRADVRLHDAARLRRDRRHVLGAQRRREHRSRGDDADGRLLRRLGADKGRTLGRSGSSSAVSSAALLALVHAYFAIHMRADQIVGGTAMNFLALGDHGLLLHPDLRRQRIPAGVSTIPNVQHPSASAQPLPRTGDRRPEHDDLGSFVLVILTYVVMFKTPIGLRIRAMRRASARRRHGRHQRLRGRATAASSLSGILAALGGVYLSVGLRRGTFTENMTDGRGFIALAALIFGNWRPAARSAAALLFGFSSAVALRLQVYWRSAATLFQALPYVMTLIAVAGVIGRVGAAGGRWQALPEAVAADRYLRPECGAATIAPRWPSLSACAALPYPAAILVARQTGKIVLLDAAWAIPVAAACGVLALLFVRGARGRIRQTLERAGGAGRIRRRRGSSRSPASASRSRRVDRGRFVRAVAAPREIERIRSRMPT